MKTKEYCYENVDRTVLIDMKKFYDELDKKRRKNLLSNMEEKLYYALKQIYPDAINRDFFQGENEFSYVNEMDKALFRDAVEVLIDYLNFSLKSDDIEGKNLLFRLARISNKSQVVYNAESEKNKFANGKPIKFEDLLPEERRNAAIEFSEGSKSMEELFLYCFDVGFQTFASCSGHECEDGSMTMGYIAVKLDGVQGDEKKRVINRAFESGIPITFIKAKVNNEIIINMLLDPYEREKQVLQIKEFIEKSKEELTFNSTIQNILNYVYKNDISSISVAKEKNGRIGIEEIGRASGVIRGSFEEEKVRTLYEEGRIIELNENRNFLPSDQSHVNAKDVARAILNLTKSLPGKFAESAKSTLEIIKSMFEYDKNIDFR